MKKSWPVFFFDEERDFGYWVVNIISTHSPTQYIPLSSTGNKYHCVYSLQLLIFNNILTYLASDIVKKISMAISPVITIQSDGFSIVVTGYCNTPVRFITGRLEYVCPPTRFFRVRSVGTAVTFLASERENRERVYPTATSPPSP